MSTRRSLLRVVFLVGALWAVSADGVDAQGESSAAHAHLYEPRASTWNVAALAADGEQLFVGTFDGGLLARRPDGTMHPIASTLTTYVNALFVDRTLGVLWVGTARGLVRCALPTARDCERVAAGGAVHTLLLMRDGTLLAGGDLGLLAVSRGAEPRWLDKKRGAPFRAVWALAEAADGVLFVGTTSGLYYGTLDSWFADPAGCARRGLITGDLPDDWVTALALEQTTLHVGMYHAGLVSFRWSNGKLVRQGADPTLGYVNPGGLSVLVDGRLAVATMEGLRIGTEGAFRVLHTPERDVTAFVASGPGRYWVGTRAGVVSLRLGAPAR